MTSPSHLRAQWILKSEGESSGPYTVDQIQEMQQSGKVQASDRVSADALAGEWITVEKLLQEARSLDEIVNQTQTRILAQDPEPLPGGGPIPGIPVTSDPLASVDGLFDTLQIAKQHSKVTKKIKDASSEIDPLRYGEHPDSRNRGRFFWIAGGFLFAVTALGAIIYSVLFKPKWDPKDSDPVKKVETLQETTTPAITRIAPSAPTQAAAPAHQTSTPPRPFANSESRRSDGRTEEAPRDSSDYRDARDGSRDGRDSRGDRGDRDNGGDPRGGEPANRGETSRDQSNVNSNEIVPTDERAVTPGVPTQGPDDLN